MTGKRQEPAEAQDRSREQVGRQSGGVGTKRPGNQLSRALRGRDHAGLWAVDPSCG